MNRLEVHGRLIMVVQRYAQSEPDGRIMSEEGEEAICVDLLHLIPFVEAEFGVSIREEVVESIETIDDLVDALERSLNAARSGAEEERSASS